MSTLTLSLSLSSLSHKEYTLTHSLTQSHTHTHTHTHTAASIYCVVCSNWITLPLNHTSIEHIPLYLPYDNCTNLLLLSHFIKPLLSLPKVVLSYFMATSPAHLYQGSLRPLTQLTMRECWRSTCSKCRLQWTLEPNSNRSSTWTARTSSLRHLILR